MLTKLENVASPYLYRKGWVNLMWALDKKKTFEKCCLQNVCRFVVNSLSYVKFDVYIQIYLSFLPEVCDEFTTLIFSLESWCTEDLHIPSSL